MNSLNSQDMRKEVAKSKIHTQAKPNMYVCMYTLHTDTPCTFTTLPPWIVHKQYTHPQSSSLHHVDTEDEKGVNTISYLTSWLSVPSCRVSLPRLYPNPQAATSRGAGSNKNNNHNCSKMTLCFGQWGGVPSGENTRKWRRKRKWVERAKDESWRKLGIQGRGTKRVVTGSGDSAVSRKSLYLLFVPLFFTSL